ncbi:MAG TPA: glycoside hydrolase family 6 protein [Pseudonocardiaceae bacterium]|jgi:cellulose 1,4-beta-cellobiosidase|nr:glycoside hydrolase family 6 protein [Pseudonocardiaceae bacterium]
MKGRPLSRAPRLPFRRALIAASAALLASGLAAVAVSQAHAAGACTVQYQVQNDWGAGATVNINLTNNGSALTTWSLGFSFAGNQQVSSGWNGTYSQAGAAVTVASLSYNGALATGASTSTGFNLTYSGTNAAPTAFTLNGTTCNGGGTTPPPTTTTTTTTTTPPPTTTTTTTTTGASPPPGTHVANPFVGASAYLNPDYTKEVQAQASADGSTVESDVAKYPTGIWMDQIAAIAGTSGRMGLQAQMDAALAKASSGPETIEVVIYDLPGRDCAALASNGEIPATAAGLTEYESQYIDPIAAILGNSKYSSSNLRVVAIIEPDSLPNAVTNQSLATCQAATPLYEAGTEYALNKLHAIPNVYNYMDIAHSAWLGWSSNMGPAAQEFAKVVRATTAGFNSVDGFISNTANYTPTTEPFLPNSTLQVGGQQLDSANFYQFNPFFDEHTYDNSMYSTLVSAGFPSRIGFLIDTSRNGWGGSGRPTALNSSPTTPQAYVLANKIDERSFRGDWCNQDNAGIGARPQAQPFGSSDHVIAFVWIKPPGESDGDYPTSTHTHGDPHCDPSGTNTDGNGGTYSTGSFPGFDVPAGQWFNAEFTQLVQNAFPAMS